MKAIDVEVEEFDGDDDDGEEPLPGRPGCLSLRNPVGRLAWLSMLSGAAFAATVWPGKLSGWYFHAAVFVWILTAIVWAWWISIVVRTLLVFRRMKNELEQKWTKR